MVFQNYALYPHMSVEKNLGYGLKVRKTPRRRSSGASPRRRACSAWRSCSIVVRRRSPAASASVLRWARDRPRAGRLPDGRAALEPRREAPRRHARRALAPARRLGVTTVYVTHDQIEAMTLGERVAVMRDGADPAGRQAPGSLPPAGQPFRGGLHRVPLDESRRGRASRGRRVRRPADPAGREAPPGEGGRAILGIRPEDFEDAEYAESGRPESTWTSRSSRSSAQRRT